MKVSFAFATATLVSVATFVAVLLLGTVLYQSIYSNSNATSPQIAARTPSAHLGLRKPVNTQKTAQQKPTKSDVSKSVNRVASTKANLVPPLFVPVANVSRVTQTPQPSKQDSSVQIDSAYPLNQGQQSPLASFDAQQKNEQTAVSPTVGGDQFVANQQVVPAKQWPNLSELMPPQSTETDSDSPPAFDDFLDPDEGQTNSYSGPKTPPVASYQALDDAAWLESLAQSNQQNTHSQQPQVSYDNELNQVSVEATVGATNPTKPQVFAAPTEELLARSSQKIAQELATKTNQSTLPSVDVAENAQANSLENTLSDSIEDQLVADNTRPTQDAQTSTPLVDSAGSTPAQVTFSDTTHTSITASSQPKTNQPSTDELPKQAISRANKSDSRVTGWPLPTALLVDLGKLTDVHATSEWAAVSKQTFERLNQLEIGDSDSLALILHLDQLAEQLIQFSRSATNDPNYSQIASYLFEVSTKMKRRASLWQAIHRLAARKIIEGPGEIPTTIAAQISLRNSEINVNSLDSNWTKYLMLDKAHEVFNNPKSSQIKRQAVAFKVLARATSNSLTPEQTNYAQDLIGNNLGNVLRNVAVAKLNLGEFLIAVEAYESNPARHTTRLNHYYQRYYWNRDVEVQELSALLDNEYRRANVRLQFAQRMINRLVPRTPTIQQPISDLILDARVRGHSRITNQIQVQMVPDPNHLSFRLTSNGRVLSNTSAHARGFVFKSLGNALVNASKTVAIGENGVSMRPTAVQANSQTRLTGIQSNLDAVPVIGWLARRLAHQQQQATGFQAKQIIESKLKSEFRARVDSELEKGVLNAQSWVQANVFEPLQQLELEPTVMHLQTEPQSAIVEYRLASLDQIAGDSPRPTVAANNLISFQMHSSAINNMLNRLHINGKKFTPDSFVEHINQLIGETKLSIGDEDHNDVTFEFARKNSIQLGFQDSRLEISLRLRRLQIGKIGRWKDLIVTAKYRPVAVGNHIFLTLDESNGVSLTGERLRLGDQFAVRTVFLSLFQPKFDFRLLPPELANHAAMQSVAVSQLGLSNGWLTLAFNETNAAQYGVQAARQTQNSHNFFRNGYRATNTPTYRLGDQQRYQQQQYR